MKNYYLIGHDRHEPYVEISDLIKEFTLAQKVSFNLINLCNISNNLSKVIDSSDIYTCCEDVNAELANDYNLKTISLNLCGKNYWRNLFIAIKNKSSSRIYNSKYIDGSYYIQPQKQIYNHHNLKSAKANIFHEKIESVLKKDLYPWFPYNRTHLHIPNLKLRVYFHLIKNKFRQQLKSNHNNWQISLINRKSKSITFSDYGYADPFIICENNRHFIIAESINQYGFGKIVYSLIDENKNDLMFKDLITQNYHLSFPFIFKMDGKTYIIPESNYGNRTFIYEISIQENKIEVIRSREITSDLFTDPIIIKLAENQFAISGIRKSITPKYHFPVFQKFDFNSSENSKLMEFESSFLNQRNAGLLAVNDTKVRVTQRNDYEYGCGLNFTLLEISENQIEEVVLAEFTFTIPTHTYSICSHYLATDHFDKAKSKRVDMKLSIGLDLLQLSEVLEFE